MYLNMVALPKGAGHDECLEALYKLCDFDLDVTGGNGEEETEEEALDEGYSSTIEWLFETSNFDCIDAIEDALNSWLDSDGYYYDYEVKRIDVQDSVVITVVALEVEE